MYAQHSIYLGHYISYYGHHHTLLQTLCLKANVLLVTSVVKKSKMGLTDANGSQDASRVYLFCRLKVKIHFLSFSNF